MQRRENAYRLGSPNYLMVNTSPDESFFLTFGVSPVNLLGNVPESLDSYLRCRSVVANFKLQLPVSHLPGGAQKSRNDK